MIHRLLAIAGNTFIEVIRHPEYLIITGCTILMILLMPYLTAFAMLSNARLIKDMALATALLGGLLLAVFSASNVLFHEIESKTALTVMTKPVGRPVFILGKYAGLLLALGIAQYLFTLVLLLTVRILATTKLFGNV